MKSKSTQVGLGLTEQLDDLELTVLRPPPPQVWDYRHVV